MKETRTAEEIRQANIKEFTTALNAGWKHVQGHVYMSPSGTKHDLSAADLTKLESIEKNKYFLVS
jgi:hypothetical protein